jgi:hypothetical protein
VSNLASIINVIFASQIGLFLLMASLVFTSFKPPQARGYSTYSETLRLQTENARSDKTKAVNPLSSSLSGGLPRADEVWQQFTADGRYRMADVGDFKFSEAARIAGGIDIMHWIKIPAIDGDFDEDYLLRDVAVLVIDKMREGDNRFAIAIFNAPQDNETVAQPLWLFVGQDLSATFLERSRDGPGVRQYRPDGTFSTCHVKWDKVKEEYNCK